MEEKSKNDITEELVHSARELIEHLESGRSDQANLLINKINRLQEDSLYQQLGKLTRELHSALTEFQGDINIPGIGVEGKAPDAKGRLEFVISLTEDAANRTMDGIEKAIPISENLAKEAKRLFLAWDKFQRREMSSDEFRVLYKEVLAYLDGTQKETAVLNEKMQEVLLAQEYQDLTGQVIKKIIRMVSNLEARLLELLAIASNAEKALKMGIVNTQELLTQPLETKEPLKTVETEVAGKRYSQNDVDDLLSSLGF